MYLFNDLPFKHKYFCQMLYQCAQSAYYNVLLYEVRQQSMPTSFKNLMKEKQV
jgi:hypothetical protein